MVDSLVFSELVATAVLVVPTVVRTVVVVVELAVADVGFSLVDGL